MTMFASSILAPTITAMARDYKEHSLTKVSMPVSIFLLGYAVGPLFLSPLSEIYGRHVVLVAANASFCAWLLACALAPSLNTLIFFRFMCGIGGSACQTIGGGVIADMFPLEQRGRAMSIWAMGPMFGPSIAPLIGGYTTETIGWKWTNWISFIPATIAVLLMSIFSRETNAIVLMQRKTRKLRKELGLRQLRSCYVNIYTPARSRRQILLHGLVRPLKMLFRSVIIFGVSLYIAFAYGKLLSSLDFTVQVLIH
jgi:multidrug resistance protein